MTYEQIIDFTLSSTTLPNTFLLGIAFGVCAYRVWRLHNVMIVRKAKSQHAKEMAFRWRNLVDFTTLIFAVFLQSCAATWSRMGRALGLYELHDLDELLLLIRLIIFFSAIRLIYRVTHRHWQKRVTKLAVLGAITLAILSGIFALHHNLYCPLTGPGKC